MAIQYYPCPRPRAIDLKTETRTWERTNLDLVQTGRQDLHSHSMAMFLTEGEPTTRSVVISGDVHQESRWWREWWSLLHHPWLPLREAPETYDNSRKGVGTKNWRPPTSTPRCLSFRVPWSWAIPSFKDSSERPKRSGLKWMACIWLATLGQIRHIHGALATLSTFWQVHFQWDWSTCFLLTEPIAQAWLEPTKQLVW